MKKLLICSNIVLLSLLFFMSCRKDSVTPIDGSPAGKHASHTGKNGAEAGRTDCPDCYNHELTPFEGVNAATAWNISNLYKTQNQPLLYIDGVGDDANSIWFSIESMKNFIWKVESAICEQNCPRPLQLGLRVYYAKYPAQLSGDLADLDQDFAQRHTIFMVPTFQDQSNPQVHWDFDPWHWGDNPCKPTPMAQWFEQAGMKPFGEDNSLIFSIDENQYFMTGNGTLSSAMNHGDLIPPYPMQGTGY